MSNPRKALDDLRLQGSPNLRRAVQREKADEDAPPLSAEQQTELEQLSDLIAQTMKACRKGSTVNNRRNPAFQNLSTLIKTRDLLMRGRKPGKKSASQLLVEADKLSAAPTGVN